VSDPKFVNLIAIEVHTDGKTITLKKPDWEIRNQAYSLHGQDVSVNPGAVTFPLVIELTSATKDYRIAGVGFGLYLFPILTPEPPQYTKAGPCGGCFSLTADLDEPTVQILDAPTKGDPGVYAYKLWVENVITHEMVSHDPRIYNHGKLDPASWFGRLIAWLRCLFSRRRGGR
jgi:hypothetical protein